MRKIYSILCILFISSFAFSQNNKFEKEVLSIIGTIIQEEIITTNDMLIWYNNDSVCIIGHSTDYLKPDPEYVMVIGDTKVLVVPRKVVFFFDIKTWYRIDTLHIDSDVANISFEHIKKDTIYNEIDVRLIKEHNDWIVSTSRIENLIPPLKYLPPSIRTE